MVYDFKQLYLTHNLPRPGDYREFCLLIVPHEVMRSLIVYDCTLTASSTRCEWALAKDRALKTIPVFALSI